MAGGGGEGDDRHLRVRLFDGRSEVLHRLRSEIEHRDDQLELPGLQQFERLFSAGSVGDLRRIGEPELGVLDVELLFDPAILFQEETIIVVADEQHIVDMVEHQVAERQPGRVEGVHGKSVA